MRVIFFLFFISSKIGAQSLLVNGGFEDVNTCTEYKIECSPEAWMPSQNTFTSFFRMPGRAFRGTHCMGFEAGHFRQVMNRSFIRSRLLCGLRAGAKYRIRFMIKSPYAVHDSVGIVFGDKDPLLDRRNYFRQSPSLYLSEHVAGFNLTDSSWYPVEIDYTANGREVYFSIGYFGKKEPQVTQIIPMENRKYVFIDEVSMVALDPNEKICRNWQTAMEDIYAENERHEFMEKMIKYRQSNPPVIEMERTTVVKIDTLVLPDILFATGKAELQQQSFERLDAIVQRMKSSVIDSLVVEGHTDNTGTASNNEKLSLARANTVLNYLTRTITGITTISRGHAARKPVSPNDTPEGRSNNRRVEIYIYIRD